MSSTPVWRFEETEGGNVEVIYHFLNKDCLILCTVLIIPSRCQVTIELPGVVSVADIDATIDGRVIEVGEPVLFPSDPQTNS